MTERTIGASTMGRGIVQLFAQAGHALVVHDAVAGGRLRPWRSSGGKA